LILLRNHSFFSIDKMVFKKELLFLYKHMTNKEIEREMFLEKIVCRRIKNVGSLFQS